MEKYEVKERLYLTEDSSLLVPEGHPDARWFYAVPGHTLSLDVARKYGLPVPAGDKPEPKKKARKDEPKAHPVGIRTPVKES